MTEAISPPFMVPSVREIQREGDETDHSKTLAHQMAGKVQRVLLCDAFSLISPCESVPPLSREGDGAYEWREENKAHRPFQFSGRRTPKDTLF
jgi:hypothetical protein